MLPQSTGDSRGSPRKNALGREKLEPGSGRCREIPLCPPEPRMSSPPLPQPMGGHFLGRMKYLEGVTFPAASDRTCHPLSCYTAALGAPKPALLFWSLNPLCALRAAKISQGTDFLSKCSLGTPEPGAAPSSLLAIPDAGAGGSNATGSVPKLQLTCVTAKRTHPA